jgi:hypothetical protein
MMEILPMQLQKLILRRLLQESKQLELVQEKV